MCTLSTPGVFGLHLKDIAGGWVSPCRLPPDQGETGVGGIRHVQVPDQSWGFWMAQTSSQPPSPSPLNSMPNSHKTLLSLLLPASTFNTLNSQLCIFNKLQIQFSLSQHFHPSSHYSPNSTYPTHSAPLFKKSSHLPTSIHCSASLSLPKLSTLYHLPNTPTHPQTCLYYLT